MKKIILLFLGILFITISSFSQQKERYYQEKFAKIVNGEMEVVLKDKTRVDIVTNDYAIEVDFAHKWAEAIGQSLYYAKELNKKPGILLVWSGDNEIRYLNRLMEVAVEHGIKVWVWNWTDDTWSSVRYNLQYLY